MLQSAFPAGQNKEYLLCCVFPAGIRTLRATGPPKQENFPFRELIPTSLSFIPVFSLASREIAGSTNIPWHLSPPCISGLCKLLHTKPGFNPRAHEESLWFYWDSRNPQTARAGTCRSLMTENSSFKIFKAGQGLQFCLCLLRESRGGKHWTQFQRFDSAALGT